MHYHTYEAADFAADESFVAYYLNSEVEAVAFWQQWIAAHPEKRQEVQEAKLLLSKLYLHLNENEVAMAFSRFDTFLSKNEVAPKKNSGFFFQKYLKIAVVAAIFAAISFFLVYKYPYISNNTAYVSSYSGFGNKKTITLADGSKVILNSNSTLKFPENFSGDYRNVELTGEAFFEIAHNANKPFVVKSGKVFTKVLGTKFNVSAYTNVATIRVALVEGSVAIKTEFDKALKLIPKQMATFYPSTKDLKISTFDETEITAWKTGTIIFNNSNFEEIAAQLYNNYGVTLINKSGEKQWNYNGRFQKTTYTDIIKNICFAKSLNYQLKEKTITITK